MPIFVTVPVDVPPTLQITPEMISENIAAYAQGYVDALASKQSTICPTMTQEEYEQNYISLEEMGNRLHAHVNKLFDKKVVCE